MVIFVNLYEGTGTSIKELMKYVKENNIEVIWAFRSVFMEGPPDRCENSADYFTKIGAPVNL